MWREALKQKVVIVTDTTACIPQDQVDRYSIVVIPIELVFEERAYHDGIDITPSEFYAMLKQAKKPPTTAGALPGPYLEAYKKALTKAGNKVFRVELIPGADHNIILCETGSMRERSRRSSKEWQNYSPEYLKIMEEWLKERLSNADKNF